MFEYDNDIEDADIIRRVTTEPDVVVHVSGENRYLPDSTQRQKHMFCPTAERI